jgi:hypothetical protein
MRCSILVWIMALCVWSASETLGLRLSYKRVLAGAVALTLFQAESPLAHAAVDTSQIKSLNEEVTKLKSVQDALDSRDIPYNDLASGASFRQFRDGKGDKVVTRGSTIAVEMTLRAKKLATQREPGGVMYFSTAKDTTSGQISWTIGDGTAIPAIEEALLADGGAKRSGIRRIDIPSTAVFKARKEGQLPERTNEDEIRLTRNLFKTQADMIAEVRVMKIIPAPTEAEKVVLPEATAPSV